MALKSGPKPLPRIACPCPICGTVRMMLPSALARQKKAYCSRPCRDIGHQRHGETHKGTLSPEYKIWRSMKNRCFNANDPDYAYYGARGITVYEGWRTDFQAFLAEVGRRPSPHHTLERINNNLGYIPHNIRWATRQEQARNTRRNRFLTFNGITQPLQQWIQDPAIALLGITRPVLTSRLDQGWSDEDPLTLPKGYRLHHDGTFHLSLSEEQHQAIYEEYLHGARQVDLAKKYGCVKTNISRIVCKYRRLLAI